MTLIIGWILQKWDIQYDMAFCCLQENLVINMGKDNRYCKKTGIDVAKTASKRVVQKNQKQQQIQLEIK